MYFLSDTRRNTDIVESFVFELSNHIELLTLHYHLEIIQKKHDAFDNGQSCLSHRC